jgi:hypothetical protein
MILSREINVKITESNYNYYDNLGYDVYISEQIIIPVELLPKGSHYKIKCKCDDCGIEKEVIYKNYLKYDNKWGDYYCRKCSEKKRKETLRKNYGVDYPIQNKGVLEKMKNTLVSKYGVDNISKNKKNENEKIKRK